MVTFLRRKKVDRFSIGEETALDRKGKVDGSSLLDGNGDPTDGSLYNSQTHSKKAAQKKKGDDKTENHSHPNQPAMTDIHGITKGSANSRPLYPAHNESLPSPINCPKPVSFAPKKSTVWSKLRR
uniref:AlNc14C82G5326 protein n=1 Tax=Albugo laibachii Nc14 TaxID=890382 RepID=F0WFD6_9STRA|nr:AlNc14C82G5326 [Albugo laibachii Nc14]|eukprot:CCA19918.1 AlNc14C82G5326 [Albugo laibachii Nc14]